MKYDTRVRVISNLMQWSSTLRQCILHLVAGKNQHGNGRKLSLHTARSDGQLLSPSSNVSSSHAHDALSNHVSSKHRLKLLCMFVWRASCCLECEGFALNSSKVGFHSERCRTKSYLIHSIAKKPTIFDHQKMARTLGLNPWASPGSIAVATAADATRLFSSQSPEIPLLSLSEKIQAAFKERETDGILQFALATPSCTDDNNDTDKQPNVLKYTAKQLIDASLEASASKKPNRSINKVHAAGMINAWVGSCCLLLRDPIIAAQKVEQLLQEYDALAPSSSSSKKSESQSLLAINLVPDVVTLSLAYTAYLRASRWSDKKQEDNTSEIRKYYTLLAESILDRAERASKKQAGSKRRKALAAARRKGSPNTDCHSVEDELRQLLGCEDFSILQESDDFLVINKPSGVACYHARSTTAGKIKSNRKRKKKSGTQKDKQDVELTSITSRIADISLEDALLHFNIPLSTLNPDSLGLVHRLDRGTSGCIVLAKTNSMHACLVAEFFLRRTSKNYMAVVSPAPSEGELSNGSTGDSKRDDEGTCTTIDLPVDGRPAISKIRQIQRYEDETLGTLGALLHVEIMTGRKHQVRVHCAQGLGCPVLMDSLYGSPDDMKQPHNGMRISVLRNILTRPNDSKDDRLFLHSHQLSIPEYGVQAQAPCPWKGISN